jgi:hypothetical protein
MELGINIMTALILKWRRIFYVRRAHFRREIYKSTGEFGYMRHLMNYKIFGPLFAELTASSPHESGYNGSEMEDNTMAQVAVKFPTC